MAGDKNIIVQKLLDLILSYEVHKSLKFHYLIITFNKGVIRMYVCTNITWQYISHLIRACNIFKF